MLQCLDFWPWHFVVYLHILTLANYVKKILPRKVAQCFLLVLCRRKSPTNLTETDQYIVVMEVAICQIKKQETGGF